jgi:hypothetical protein
MNKEEICEWRQELLTKLYEAAVSPGFAEALITGQYRELLEAVEDVIAAAPRYVEAGSELREVLSARDVYYLTRGQP